MYCDHQSEGSFEKKKLFLDVTRRQQQLVPYKNMTSMKPVKWTSTRTP